MTRKIEFTPEMVERILSELAQHHSSDESGTTRLDDEIRAILEAPVEVRELTWVELVNAVSEVRGSEFTPDPDFFIGHQMTEINFNSLRRIVEKFRGQTEQSIAEVLKNSKRLAELDDSTIAKLGDQLKASVQLNTELVELLREVSGKLPLLSDKALWARIATVVNPAVKPAGLAVELESLVIRDEIVGVPRRLLEAINSYEWRGELASSNAMFLRGILEGRITGYEIQPAAPVQGAAPELAEFQATIAQQKDDQDSLQEVIDLTAKAVGDNTGLMWMKIQTAFLRDMPEMRKRIAQLTTENEGLKFGRGEPVAWEYKRKNQSHFGEPDTHISFASKTLNECRVGLISGEYTLLFPREDYFDWKPLFYGSMPSPVAIEADAKINDSGTSQ
ncbi:hypothetical protein [Pseudomonas serbica]|uniref:hypothetical protein n=1 Tax=Pseudomonas serbica TaxID=2965074 RepID=UPI00237A1BF0|nr:hypothetical protein [Pseudomonas serbica]